MIAFKAHRLDRRHTRAELQYFASCLEAYDDSGRCDRACNLLRWVSDGETFDAIATRIEILPSSVRCLFGLAIRMGAIAAKKQRDNSISEPAKIYNSVIVWWHAHLSEEHSTQNRNTGLLACAYVESALKSMSSSK